MNRGGWFTPALTKEMRALLPTFVSVTASIGLASFASPGLSIPLILLAACGGAAMLGAQSIGHEYTHRTLTLLLAQPSKRSRMFGLKAVVLVPLVLLVRLAAALALPGSDAPLETSPGLLTAILVLAPLSAICVAPPLAMLCRGTLPAAIFTLAIPGVLMLAAQILGTAIHGFRNPRAVEGFALLVVWRGMSVVCAAGLLLSWVQFRRL